SRSRRVARTVRDERLAIAACTALLDDSARSDEFSGVLLIARDGTPVMERAYGYACKGHGVRNHVDTLFNIGSLTKMFTAVSIMQLVERGRVSVDAAITRYLPGYPPTVGNKVTIHHLLTHTSGLGSFWIDAFQARRASLRTVSDYLQLFMDEPLAFEPGERFGYSNAGYMVLGAIVEQVSGTSYDAYVGEHIFAPAGMAHTAAHRLDDDVPNRALGYVRDSAEGDEAGPYPRTNLLVSPLKGSPAGGTYSTVHDLLRFAHALRSHQLLSAALTDLLLQPRVPMGPRGDASYAYGFGYHNVGGFRIVGHNGGAPGVGAQLDMYLDLGYTVVLLSNYDAGTWMKVLPSIRQILTGM
ncbi:MAG TPA: serine hydrolase domain-containing protein, partial [Chloroflexota bacterium]